jgi:hypothetical protein
MDTRAKKSARVRIAAAFIEWVVAAVAIGGVFPLIYGWSEGAAMLFGALFVGVLGFLAHLAVIRRGEA